MSGKRRRLTFIECNNDINSMIDLAKVADIVLLMIDGNYGFEMETMEFLNILAPHGLPSNIFGILTHLDLFKSQSTLKATKKRLKHRFWSELYQGAKLFYLSGVMNGRYPDREILNLSRFISVMKNPRPIKWRNDHYYLLADRLVDLTDPAEIEKDKNADRQVALYGYVRGQNLPAENGQVHVPGVGDLSIVSAEQLPEPCPTPYQNKLAGKTRKRLGEKERLLYAPMSDVGGVLVDKDAVYVDIPTQNFNAEGLRDGAGMGERLVVGLQHGMQVNASESGVQLFAGGQFIKRVEAQEEEQDPGNTGRKTKRTARLIDKAEGDHDGNLADGECDEDEDEDGNDQFNSGDEAEYEKAEEEEEEEEEEESIATRKPGRSLRHDLSDDPTRAGKETIEFADSDSDLGSISGDASNLSLDEGDIEDDDLGSDDDDEDGALRWKENLSEKARKMFAAGPADRIGDLSRMLYDESLSPADVIKRWRGDISGDNQGDHGRGEEDDEDDFFKKVEEDDERQDIMDRSLPAYDLEKLNQRWSDQDELEALRRRFVTASLLGDREAAKATDGEDGEWGGINSNDDSEGDGEFEDLETGVKSGSNAPENDIETERAANARKKAELRLRFEEEDREGLNRSRNGPEDDTSPPKEFGEDDWYASQKAQLAKQSTINKHELSLLPNPEQRIRSSGYPSGSYVRIVLSSLPSQFITNFSPTYPLLVGGLNPTETRFGFLQTRIKRHRWHKKILKTNDPLIISLGWRRFQTQLIYSISDSRTRNRMLKYTPEHLHCFGTFWGPLIPPNTGFCAFNTLSPSAPYFRVAATGVVLSLDATTTIVKKLKLTGTPLKIYKNTAFIQNMFHTSLEIAKFESASIRTVSGIRGQIKRALAKPEGAFRATFEDKILMSDIVFLRAWYPIKPNRYYNVVTNLLLPSAEKPNWTGMRLTGQLRRDLSVPTPTNPDSTYRPVTTRPATRRFNPLKIPKSILSQLPYKSRLVTTLPQRKKTYLQTRLAVIDTTREERKARELLHQVNLLSKEKTRKRKEKDGVKREKWLRKVKEGEEKRGEREKKEKEEYWRREGRKRGRQDGGEGGGGGGGGGGKRRKG